LTFNTDFFVGYSPERINPGERTYGYKILKVTSGSTPEVGLQVDVVSVIMKLIWPFYKVAEAKK
jgi:UDP-N-acetyl-D-galactosamine dehydrogenase